MVYVDGMVGRLGELVQDAHAAPGLGGGGEYGQAELLAADGLRAGEGEDQAAGSHLGYAGGIEPLVAAQGIAQGRAVFGEGRRVQDDEVIGAGLGMVQIFESVLGE